MMEYVIWKKEGMVHEGICNFEKGEAKNEVTCYLVGAGGMVP